MDIKISDEQMRTLVAQSILNTLDQVNRDKLIESAIATMLMSQPKDRYGQPQKSEIQTIFDDAVAFAARKFVAEYLERPEQSARLRAVLVDALEKLLNNGAELSTRIANAVHNAITRSVGG